MNKGNVRLVLAENLKKLMAEHPELGTQMKLARRCGVSQTSIGQFLRPENGLVKGPLLIQVEKVAQAFGLYTWQLLVDRQSLQGVGLVDILLKTTIPAHPAGNKVSEPGKDYSTPPLLNSARQSNLIDET